MIDHTAPSLATGRMEACASTPCNWDGWTASTPTPTSFYQSSLDTLHIRWRDFADTFSGVSAVAAPTRVRMQVLVGAPTTADRATTPSCQVTHCEICASPTDDAPSWTSSGSTSYMGAFTCGTSGVYTWTLPNTMDRWGGQELNSL